MWTHKIASPAAVVALGAALFCCAQRTARAAAWYGALESHSFLLPPIVARALPAWVRFSTLDFFGSVVCCADYRRGSRPRASRTRAAELDPEPQRAAEPAPRVLADVELPRRPVDHGVRNSFVLRLFFATGAALSSGHAITSWGQDKALNAFHVQAQGAVFSALIAGAVGASGGGLLAALLDPFGERPVGQRSYGAFLRAAVGSVAYYLLRDPHGVLADEYGYAAVAPATAKLVVGAYAVLGAVPDMVVTFDASPYAPARLVEAAVRFALRVPARVGAPPAKAKTA
ncbi:hypothetical protein JL722_4169 [Aureococcus anophagefferens]|nr:hypothetical protein JL722_4169 [Aureococcus anophagefferens]